MIRGLPPSRGSAGFILPGVIMFIFVLTIIGLSLFALSSYEAQFMYRTLDEAQAFYDASGGIERARFLLASTRMLSSVTTGMAGTGNIDIASATQTSGGPPDSLGQVKWGSNYPVIIRVEANKNGKKRMLQGAFYPTSQPYDNLFSMSATNRGLFISKQSPNNDPNGHVFLSGNVWQTYSGLCAPPCPQGQFDWNENIYPTANPNSFTVDLGTVPPPQVSTFYAAHEAGLPGPQVQGGQNYTLDASAPPGIKFFKTEKVGGDWSLAVQGQGNPVDITVHGIAVWMFDSGFYSERQVLVHGTSTDMLVLIAKKTNDTSPQQFASTYGVNNIGFIFKAGLQSPTVPVIVVSDGYFAIDQDGPPQQSINWLSVYANFAWVRGPDLPAGDPSGLYQFAHVVDAQPDAEANLQKLLDQTLLPNATPQRRHLTFIPGTWLELGTN